MEQWPKTGQKRIKIVKKNTKHSSGFGSKNTSTRSINLFHQCSFSIISENVNKPEDKQRQKKKT